MSYAAPVTQMLLLPFFFIFTSVVRWVFIDDTSSAPGTLGELYGKFGQYTLAFFPWDRAYSIAWMVIGMLIVLTGLARVALEGTWSGSERQALDDVGWPDTLVIASLFLAALWYVPAIQIARPGWAGIASAVVASGVLCLATASSVVGVAMYDAWGRKSVAVLLFGELAWGAYAGFLVYALAMSMASLLERCRFEPDPNWLYERICLAYRESYAQRGLARLYKKAYRGTSGRFDPKKSGRRRMSSDTVDIPTVVPPAARPLGTRTSSELAPPTRTDPDGRPRNFTRSEIREAQMQYRQNKPKRPTAYHQARNDRALSNMADDMNHGAQWNQGALRHHEMWTTTAFKRWAGDFTRDLYKTSDPDDSDSDTETEAAVVRDQDGNLYTSHRCERVNSGDYELITGVLLQALLVGGLAVAAKSPTMPLLPFIAFNNLVPEVEGPRLIGSVAMVLSVGISLALGVARWVEA